MLCAHFQVCSVALACATCAVASALAARLHLLPRPFSFFVRSLVPLAPWRVAYMEMELDTITRASPTRMGLLRQVTRIAPSI